MNILLHSIMRKVAGMSMLLCCLSAAPVFAENAGVVGKKLADVSLKVTSVSYLDDRTSVNMQSNGEVGPFGTIGVTATFMKPLDAKATVGQYKANARSFRPDGSMMNAKIQGAWKSLGKHRWEVKTIGVNSEGGRTFTVGVLELATMTFTGVVYSLD